METDAVTLARSGDSGSKSKSDVKNVADIKNGGEALSYGLSAAKRFLLT